MSALLVKQAREKMRPALDEAFREAVTEVVGHSDWPGDVDPITSIRFDDALEGVLRQLIQNGLPDYDEVVL